MQSALHFICTAGGDGCALKDRSTHLVTLKSDGYGYSSPYFNQDSKTQADQGRATHDALSLPDERPGLSRNFQMKNLFVFVAFSALVFHGSACATGCLKGASVGAVAGHVAGRHAVLGAIGGCVVGRHLAKEKAAAKANSVREK